VKDPVHHIAMMLLLTRDSGTRTDSDPSLPRRTRCISSPGGRSPRGCCPWPVERNRRPGSGPSRRCGRERPASADRSCPRPGSAGSWSQNSPSMPGMRRQPPDIGAPVPHPWPSHVRDILARGTPHARSRPCGRRSTPRRRRRRTRARPRTGTQRQKPPMGTSGRSGCVSGRDQQGPVICGAAVWSW